MRQNISNCIKYFFVAFIVIFPCAIFADDSLPSPNATPVESLNTIVAVVNDEVITYQQLQTAIANTKQQLTQRHIDVPPEAALEKQVLDQLIYQHLQLQLVKRSKIKVSNTEVNNAIKRIAENNHVTESQLKKQLEKDHMSYDMFQKQVREQLLITKLQQQALGGQVNITAKDIADYREKYQIPTDNTEYHVIDYLVTVDDPNNETQWKTAESRAKTLEEALTSGTTHTIETENDLRFRTASALPELFAKAVTQLKAGGISEPIKAPNGYHVLQLVEIRQNANIPNKEQIQNLVYQEKINAQLMKWLQELRKSAYIKINITQ